MPKLYVLTQKSEIGLQLEANGTTKGKYNRGLQFLSPFTHYNCYLSPDPMGYYGSNPWCGIAKILTTNKCSEHLVPVCPTNPEEVHWLCDKSKTHRCFLGIIQCHGSQHTKTLVYAPERPSEFSQRPCEYHASKGRLRSRRDFLEYPRPECSHLQRRLTVMSSKIFW